MSIDCGVPYAGTMSEPGGPGAPAGARSPLEEGPLTKLSTWPLILRRSLLLENRKQESSWTAARAVSEAVTATHGMPPGCGHAVDLLHAFLLNTLKSAGRHVTVHKYVDDMVLVASGPCFAGHLCYGYRQVHKSLTKANMKVNLKKTVVICNGANAKRLLIKVWRAGRLPPSRHY
eukprot:3076594-Amphidinium_carterae.2